jgi:hypothetical protein
LHILITFSIKRSLTSWWKSCALSPYILAPLVFLSPLARSSNLISVLSELRCNLEQPPFGSLSSRNKSRESTAVQCTLDSTTTFSLRSISVILQPRFSYKPGSTLYSISPLFAFALTCGSSLNMFSHRYEASATVDNQKHYLPSSNAYSQLCRTQNYRLSCFHSVWYCSYCAIIKDWSFVLSVALSRGPRGRNITV